MIMADDTAPAPGLGTSFGSAAEDYQRARPGYPSEAVSWLLDDNPVVVVDVGAGTGKLTQALIAPGRMTIAIDPDAVMLQTLVSVVPGVTTRVGSAERLPLDDASVDSAVFGQAWHWVDPVVASREVGRVVRPGGRLGLVWNIRDERVPWIARFTDIMGGSAAEGLIAGGGPRVHDPFGALEVATFDWSQPVTAATLFELAHSRSRVIAANAADRARIDRELSELFASLPGLAHGGSIELPYRTHAYRATRR